MASIALGGWWIHHLQIAQIDAVTPGGTEISLEVARLRVEAIRNTLLVGAGIGGLSALVLGFRRQQHGEYDATQKLITELRLKAVEQLGSDSPVIRIGGLHNLERLGEQHNDLRQIVIDEICSYLRLPFTSIKDFSSIQLRFDQFEPIGPPAASTDRSEQELEVRMIAQEILIRHLNPRHGSRHYWKHNRLNLKNAYLVDADFSECQLRFANFSGATFTRPASFNGTTFYYADFNGAKFEDQASFIASKFQTDASFESAKFHSDALFMDASFHAVASFSDASFHGRADFGGTNHPSARLGRDFNGQIHVGTIFGRESYFVSVEFLGTVRFEQVVFHDDAIFGVARFHGDTFFRNAVIHDRKCQTHRDLVNKLSSTGSEFQDRSKHHFPDGWELKTPHNDTSWAKLIKIQPQR